MAFLLLPHLLQYLKVWGGGNTVMEEWKPLMVRMSLCLRRTPFLILKPSRLLGNCSYRYSKLVRVDTIHPFGNRSYYSGITS